MDFDFLSGKKTYLVTIATLMYALGGWVAGYIETSSAINLILFALGLSGLRHGITTGADMFEEEEVPVPVNVNPTP